MTLKADMVSDVTTFANSDEFAESITWAGGESFDAVIVRGEDLANIDMASFDSVAVEAVAYIPAVNVPAPEQYDAVVTDDGTYSYIGKIESDGAMFTAALKKDERPVI